MAQLVGTELSAERSDDALDQVGETVVSEAAILSVGSKELGTGSAQPSTFDEVASETVGERWANRDVAVFAAFAFAD